MTKQTINHRAALIAGVTGGVISGLVKLGWENILPPRTPERDQTNPPQQLLQQMGVPARLTHATYTYSGQQLPGVSYVMHFGFSTTFAVAYSLWARKHPKAKAGSSAAFGLGIWGLYHHAILPALGTIPRAKDQPIEEHVSEGIGHVLWMWTADWVSDAVYRRLTK
ncbi:YagU family protein [Lactiplantibacillus mudanjiangensis]|uniref:DUF1440 domain-containing protein n=1 Tax=Lactiplantibacillus mudanjiangensis TaxID=1296538 RepID=A0A660E053_9LACO|nr:DUF1440 domain-containing protein [Lactiplantibacillus mudanjiangensis]VDG20010.1 hypothetical protein [Lactobacillus pentosus] [Lactiplantibacillus mudanjiangensis]VDG26170.1 hypothetical protein [Lactobacillus pentosus] [Lactiplantibacillus mudanjiangensis]VDG27323.1 hypothetical protein [Lactobacillus pentosus] [Lactiplantibacillus mudanjiangensis]VDG33404.1 hypothetical protein [Lactobacillus pentosus] [Lactiplantibacillus mudanjiangensis]